MRANNLNVYRYLKHILTELPKFTDEDGYINTSKLDHLFLWSYELPTQRHKPRRKNTTILIVIHLGI